MKSEDLHFHNCNVARGNFPFFYFSAGKRGLICIRGEGKSILKSSPKSPVKGRLRMPKKWLRVVTILSVVAVVHGTAQAQQSDEEDELALSYGDKLTTSIATGSKLSVSRAPAVATVITAADIKAIGATDLDQVLETVPGLHVSMLSFCSAPIYSFRGIFTSFNPQVLILVNGLPITTVFLGNRSMTWGGMPLENVARIEIIRGPGSALYGADAYSGVINIITKRADDIKGAEAGVRIGTFKTRDGFVQYGNVIDGLAVALYARVGQTDGQEGVIERDFQTTLDAVFGTHASLAPGRISASREATDLRADLAYKSWRFRAGYQKRKVGQFAGLADALDHIGREPETRLYLDLSYENLTFAKNWELSGVFGYYDVKELPGDPPFVVFPPGAFGGAFPTGAIGNPGHSERHTNLSVSAFYTGFDHHRLRLGTGYRLEDMYSTTEFKNFTLVTVPGVGTVFRPLPGLVDATGNPALVYLQPAKRNLVYAFGQDEWQFANDFSLTAGLRVDRYSDFGTTTNPRLALVWDAAYNVVIKAMHGRAYRAPSFTEQFSINNPVNIGNPHLRPETIKTNELAFSWQPAQTVQTNLTLFHYTMSDIIRFVPNADPGTGATAENTGDQTGRGLEFEVTWDASRDLRLSGNVSLQHSVDELTHADAGMAPRTRVFGRADWRFAPGWQFGTTVNKVMDRHRQFGDNRPKIADYTLVDCVISRQLADGWEVRSMIQNVFNRDAREPNFAPGNITFDLPLPRRAISLQISKKL